MTSGHEPCFPCKVHFDIKYDVAFYLLEAAKLIKPEGSLVDAVISSKKTFPSLSMCKRWICQYQAEGKLSGFLFPIGKG